MNFTRAPEHRQVKVLYEDNIIEVDEGMVEILQILWQQGVKTNYSCQDNMGTFYINFDPNDFLRLQQIIKLLNLELHNFIEEHTGVHYNNRSTILRCHIDNKNKFTTLLHNTFDNITISCC